MTSRGVLQGLAAKLMAAVNLAKQQFEIVKIRTFWSFFMGLNANFSRLGKLNKRFSRKIKNKKMDLTAPYFFHMLFVTGKYTNLRICIKLIVSFLKLDHYCVLLVLLRYYCDSWKYYCDSWKYYCDSCDTIAIVVKLLST